MSTKVHQVLRSLELARDAAKGRLREIDQERVDVKASLRSLNSAIKAFGTRDAKRKGIPTKQASSTAELVQLTEEILAHGVKLTIEQPEKRIDDKMVENGRSRVRQSLIDVLKEDRFCKFGEFYCLKEST